MFTVGYDFYHLYVQSLIFLNMFQLILYNNINLININMFTQFCKCIYWHICNANIKKYNPVQSTCNLCVCVVHPKHFSILHWGWLPIGKQTTIFQDHCGSYTTTYPKTLAYYAVQCSFSKCKEQVPVYTCFSLFFLLSFFRLAW